LHNEYEAPIMLIFARIPLGNSIALLKSFSDAIRSIFSDSGRVGSVFFNCLLD
jgi:hypothetical protein